jgi:DNA-directed RNA polymerase alpha subunit
MKIEKLDLSAYSYNMLKQAGITNVDGIMALNRADVDKLTKGKNSRVECLYEIEEKMREHGFEVNF